MAGRPAEKIAVPSRMVGLFHRYPLPCACDCGQEEDSLAALLAGIRGEVSRRS